jgi:hypothetical protein
VADDRDDHERTAAVSALRRRYETPVRIRATTSLIPFAIAVVAAAAVVAMMRALFPTLPFYIWVVFPVLAIAVGLVRLGSWWVQREQRVVELRADGVAVGRGTGTPRVIAWEAIASVTLRVVTTDGRDEIPRDLQIELAGGETVTLRGSYDRPLAEIRTLIDPPLAGRIGSVRSAR